MQVRLGASETSLEAPVSRVVDSDRRQIDTLAASGEHRPDVIAEGAEFRGILRTKMAAFESSLKGREQEIFRNRLQTDPAPNAQLGKHYGLSRERVRQIEVRLLGRLKVYLRRELGDVVRLAA